MNLVRMPESPLETVAARLSLAIVEAYEDGANTFDVYDHLDTGNYRNTAALAQACMQTLIDNGLLTGDVTEMFEQGGIIEIREKQQ